MNPNPYSMASRKAIDGQIVLDDDPLGVSGPLNIRPSSSLKYPDLSFSSFASPHEPFLVTNATSSQIDGHEVHNLGVTASGDSEHTVSLEPKALDEQPFRTPLGFHIPDESMRAALQAPEDSKQSYWQHTLYRGPAGGQHTVKVHYCKTFAKMETISQLFANDNVLGFDLEWVANSSAAQGAKRNVSLIQIANEERVGLFQIARFPTEDVAAALATSTFKQIMESPHITKVGVAIKGDSTRLRNFLHIHTQGLFELSHLHKLLKYWRG